MNNHSHQLLAFLERLDQADISYTIEHSRDNAVQITAFAPGEYWEIEFIENEGIEIERFRSNGKIYDESVLEDLFALCSDEEAVTKKVVKSNAAVTRK
jgi:hypothetical protein